MLIQLDGLDILTDPVWSERCSLRVHCILEAGLSVGIHFGTFQLADNGQDQPLDELTRALASVPAAQGRFVTRASGQGRSVTELWAEAARAVPPAG